MQKAIRNSGKISTVESIDERDAARNKPSANPIIVTSNSPYQSAVQARRPATKLDDDYEANRKAQDKREQGADPQKGD